MRIFIRKAAAAVLCVAVLGQGCAGMERKREGSLAAKHQRAVAEAIHGTGGKAPVAKKSYSGKKPKEKMTFAKGMGQVALWIELIVFVVFMAAQFGHKDCEWFGACV